MTTFLLVHGAWHGGWCWVRVADRLRAQGHRVFTPTLTGLGERSHLMRPDIDLTTHVTDVVNVMKWEDLDGIVLCGHSYAGFVISGVAEQVERAIRSIVFLDAFLPNDGDAMADLTRPVVREAIADATARGGMTVPATSAAAFFVNEKDQAWVDAKCGPHPVGTMTQRIALTGARDRITRKTYVRAARPANPGFEAALARTKADPSWRTYEVDCGHDVMVDRPERLTEILLEA